MSWQEVDLAASTCADADDRETAPDGKRVQVGLQIWCPDRLQDHVIGAVCGRVGRVDRGRAESLERPAGVRRARSRRPWRPPPGELHSCNAHAACGAVHQDPFSWPELALGEQGVVRDRERLREAAGLQNPISSGTGKAVVRERSTSSACAPPPTTAMTRSPTTKRSTPGPTAVTTPASSRPGMSAGQPGGAGYKPALWSRSALFRPAAWTRTSTSPVPATGSGRCP